MRPTPPLPHAPHAHKAIGPLATGGVHQIGGLPSGATQSAPPLRANLAMRAAHPSRALTTIGPDHRAPIGQTGPSVPNVPPAPHAHHAKISPAMGLFQNTKPNPKTAGRPSHARLPMHHPNGAPRRVTMTVSRAQPPQASQQANPMARPKTIQASVMQGPNPAANRQPRAHPALIRQTLLLRVANPALNRVPSPALNQAQRLAQSQPAEALAVAHLTPQNAQNQRVKDKPVAQIIASPAVLQLGAVKFGICAVGVASPTIDALRANRT
jgi:hypothetical protein